MLLSPLQHAILGMGTKHITMRPHMCMFKRTYVHDSTHVHVHVHNRMRLLSSSVCLPCSPPPVATDGSGHGADSLFFPSVADLITRSLLLGLWALLHAYFGWTLWRSSRAQRAAFTTAPAVVQAPSSATAPAAATAPTEMRAPAAVPALAPTPAPMPAMAAKG